MSHVIIITPLRKEYALLVQALHHHGYAGTGAVVGKMAVVSFPALSATVALGGHGKAQCAVQTQYLIDHCSEVGMVICAGAAGCLSQALQIGDIVIGTQTIEHDYTLRFVHRPLPMFDSDMPGLESFRQVVSQSAFAFGVHFGAIASGDEDIITAERAQAVAVGTRALCVAWEGAGAARACAFSGVPFLEIRGITDAADKAAPLDFSRHHEQALTNLARLLVAWRTGK